ncbi:hypothetical protein [Skermania piniformis]|uniref:hypothetical protein n=1 Tax=Skermania pinensis TaxID=39122 RepID=UPI00082BEA9C
MSGGGTGGPVTGGGTGGGSSSGGSSGGGSSSGGGTGTVTGGGTGGSSSGGGSSAGGGHNGSFPLNQASASTGTQCPDTSLAVKATIEQPTFQSGDEPVFGVVITNISTTSCSRDLGAGLLQVLVYSLDGQQRLWSNSDCFPSTTSDIRTLGPGQQAAFTVTWSAATSKPNCEGERTPVSAGAYTVVAQLGALRSTPEPFNIA